MKKTLVRYSLYLFCAVFAVMPAYAAPTSAARPEATENIHPVIQDAAQKGQRLILFFYTTDDPRFKDAAALMQELYTLRRQYNFELNAIALNAGQTEKIKTFTNDHLPEVPMISDEDGRLAQQFNMKDSLGFVLFNEQGRKTSYRQAAHTPPHMNLKQQWRTYLSTKLGIPSIPDDQPVLGLKPAAPLFKAETIDGKKLSISELHKDKPLVLIIFSPRCVNCVKELKFLNGLYTGELKGDFEILALSLMAKKPTANFARDNNYSFPIVSDPSWRLAALFPTFTGPVPVMFLINTQGTIEYVRTGFSNKVEPIYRMRLRKLAGKKNPPLLVKDGYSGEQSCMVCHEQQRLQWSLTGHAAAFASLQRKGATDDQACVACHVTGYEQPGGYQPGRPAKHLQNVQCEACHGPGYQSCSAYTGEKAANKTAAQWKTLCLKCHTKKESLNFVFPRRFKRVRHSAMPDIDSLDRTERLALLSNTEKGRNPFDNPARYMGAEACKACHAEQYQHWRSTAHASLSADNATEPDRLYRSVTGLGADGGYPEPGRDGVQCEACHGPGERHVQQPEEKGHGYIVGLGSECSSCVVEQICRTCHSVKDSPGFDFNQAIDLIRHPKPAP